jgi:uncharacterized protein (DUF1501 family)
MKTCRYACRSLDHDLSRRQLLQTVAKAGMGAAMLPGLGHFGAAAVAAEMERNQKRMIVIDLHGGSSQLETWDPKPGTNTGGPFRAIPTSVPGLHISELLPKTAKVMHHLALVRSINTKEGDHGKGQYLMSTGRRKTPAQDYPVLGAVVAKALGEQSASSLPGHIVITPNGAGGRNADSAYLGPRYGSVALGGGKPLQYSERPQNLAEEASLAGNEMRRKINERFLSRRRTAMTDAYTQSFEQGLELMRQREIFDITKESQKDLERYGSHDFGRHCLLARRLVENGITYVKVSHSNYDTHCENFNFHLEQIGEFDGPFSTLVTDLFDRGLLDHTLIVVLSEFGRTPNINATYGRDHWGKAWSICLGGAGIQRGAVFGKTNDNGTEVTEGEVDGGDLFHTYLAALGLKSTGQFTVAGQKTPMADPAHHPIDELLI